MELKDWNKVELDEKGGAMSRLNEFNWVIALNELYIHPFCLNQSGMTNSEDMYDVGIRWPSWTSEGSWSES